MKKSTNRALVGRLLAVLLAIAAPLGSFGQDEQHGAPPAYFQLNSDMLRFDAPSAALFFGWQRDVNSLIQSGFEMAMDAANLRRPENGIGRAAVLALFSAASVVANRGFSLAAHDENHMDTARALGATGVYLVSVSDGSSMNIAQFLLLAFFSPSDPAVYWYSMNNATQKDQAAVAGAGLNANLLIAAQISRRMNAGGGHVMDAVPYLLNKLWGIPYFLDDSTDSDARAYVDLVGQQGYPSPTRTGFLLLNVASSALSGGFLGLMAGGWRFLARGGTIVQPLGLRIGGASLFWPEFSTWLNPDNVSLLAEFDASVTGRAFLEIGVESAVLGNTGGNPELSVDVSADLGRVTLAAGITSRLDGVPFVRASADVALQESFSVGIGGYYGQGRTMRELREHPLGPGIVVYATLVL